MIGFQRQALFDKLNPLCYQAIEHAATFCKLRGNPYVELAHWLHQLAEPPGSDLTLIFAAFSIEADALAREIMRFLDRLPRGATALSDLAPQVEETAREAWLVATLGFGSDQIRSGHLLYACAASRSLNHGLIAISPQFHKLSLDRLRADYASITHGSCETVGSPAPSAAPTMPREAAGEALSRYTVDLTAKARAGELDPVIGRDPEIERVIAVLMRRRQNNPILTGEAGVGKTAIVEGLALKIAAGDVPPQLQHVALRALDLGLLQAGASVKGEFERRVQDVIKQVQSSLVPIILFIDEAHMLVGAGGAEGTGDAANLLKPALARGTLRTIAATTWGEYKRYIEKDAALSRRFQTVAVDEPNEPQAVAMIRGMAHTLEAHHGVEILDEAISAAVALSHRYIKARQLPDKALSLLDTACAAVGISRHGRPSRLQHQQQHADSLVLELDILARQACDGEPVGERRKEIETVLSETRAELGRLQSQWQDEKRHVEEMQAIRGSLRKTAMAGADPDGLADDDRAQRQAALLRLHEEHQRPGTEGPLVLDRVDRHAVAAVVQDWTGIPLGRLLRDEAETLLSLDAALARRVLGQDHAMETIARRVQTSRAGLDDPDKPIGVFLLCGPSGVGKTETALALANVLHGADSNLITINMSEFQEAHTVSSLKGAPPGYVGYGQGGILTEAVRRRPHAVILLDEIEKAHPDVHEIFFQVFDKGTMEDGEGRRIDFRNTLILMTSNVGSEQIAGLCMPAKRRPAPEVLEEAIRRPLREVFSPALLGRMITIPYYPLSEVMLDSIARQHLDRIGARLVRTHKVAFSYADAVVALIVARAGQVDSGGRMIDAILTNTLLPTVSRKILTQQMHGQPAAPLRLDVTDGEFAYAFGGI